MADTPFTDLFHMTGKTPYEVEQNILRLRDALDKLQQQHADTRDALNNLPPIYSLKDIQDALGPTGTNPLPTAELLNTVPAPTGGVPPPDPQPVDDGIPDHSAEVNAVYATNPVGPTSTDEEMFRFCQRVAAAILAAATDPPGLTCGLLLKAGGANVFVCNGDSYSYSRVCYNNGHVFKVVVDADPGGARTPTWADNSPPLLPAEYHVATDPSAPC
jgi:hypothetical protein